MTHNVFSGMLNLAQSLKPKTIYLWDNLMTVVNAVVFNHCGCRPIKARRRILEQNMTVVKDRIMFSEIKNIKVIVAYVSVLSFITKRTPTFKT